MNVKRKLEAIKRYLITEAIETLGVTSVLKYGVMILPDGRLIDGRWDKEYDRTRTVDHSDFPLTETGVDFLYEAMKIYAKKYGCTQEDLSTHNTIDWYYFVSGCVRYAFFENSRGPELYLEFYKPPTLAQVSRIMVIITRMNPIVYLDMSCLHDCKWEMIYSEAIDARRARSILFRVRKMYEEYKCRW